MRKQRYNQDKFELTTGALLVIAAALLFLALISFTISDVFGATAGQWISVSEFRGINTSKPVNVLDLSEARKAEGWFIDDGTLTSLTFQKMSVSVVNGRPAVLIGQSRSDSSLIMLTNTLKRLNVNTDAEAVVDVSALQSPIDSVVGKGILYSGLKERDAVQSYEFANGYPANTYSVAKVGNKDSVHPSWLFFVMEERPSMTVAHPGTGVHIDLQDILFKNNKYFSSINGDEIGTGGQAYHDIPNVELEFSSGTGSVEYRSAYATADWDTTLLLDGEHMYHYHSGALTDAISDTLNYPPYSWYGQAHVTKVGESLKVAIDTTGPMYDSLKSIFKSDGLTTDSTAVSPNFMMLLDDTAAISINHPFTMRYYTTNASVVGADSMEITTYADTTIWRHVFADQDTFTTEAIIVRTAMINADADGPFVNWGSYFINEPVGSGGTDTIIDLGWYGGLYYQKILVSPFRDMCEASGVSDFEELAQEWEDLTTGEVWYVSNRSYSYDTLTFNLADTAEGNIRLQNNDPDTAWRRPILTGVTGQFDPDTTYVSDHFAYWNGNKFEPWSDNGFTDTMTYYQLTWLSPYYDGNTPSSANLPSDTIYFRLYPSAGRAQQDTTFPTGSYLNKVTLKQRLWKDPGYMAYLDAYWIAEYGDTTTTVGNTLLWYSRPYTSNWWSWKTMTGSLSIAEGDSLVLSDSLNTWFRNGIGFYLMPRSASYPSYPQVSPDTVNFKLSTFRAIREFRYPIDTANIVLRSVTRVVGSPIVVTFLAFSKDSFNLGPGAIDTLTFWRNKRPTNWKTVIDSAAEAFGPQYGQEHRRRVWYNTNDAEPMAIYWSELNKPDNVAQIDANIERLEGSNPTTGLSSLGQDIIHYRRYGIIAVSGFSEDYFNLRPIQTDIGAPNHLAIARDTRRSRDMFPNERGIWAFNGSVPTQIAENIETIMRDSVNWDYYQKVRLEIGDDIAILSYPHLGDTACSRTMLIDLDVDNLTEATVTYLPSFNINSMWLYQGSTEREDVFIGEEDSSAVWLLNGDDDRRIDCDWRSGWYKNDERVRIERYEMDYEGDSGDTILVDFYTDYSETVVFTDTVLCTGSRERTIFGIPWKVQGNELSFGLRKWQASPKVSRFRIEVFSQGERRW